MHAYDVIIVGGGPGGAAAATALARRGRRVLVLEREAFPRFHIGESQLPWSRELWRELGLDEALGRAGFVDKWGATFITANGAVEQYAGFAARRRSERQFDPQLRNVSLHAQYEDVPRPTGRRAGDIRMVMRPDRGWFWFIPLSATVTS